MKTKIILVTRWTARILGIMLALFLLLIVLTVLKGGKGVNIADLIDIIFFLSLFVGLILLWPREGLGIILCYAGLLGFILHDMYSHGPNLGWYKALYLAIPPTMLVICRMAKEESKEGQ